jgi:hypothetical protein
MNTRRLNQMLVAVPMMVCAVLLIALAAPAAAQSEACIHVQVGTGYTACLRVSYQDQGFGTCPISPGNTTCVSLDGVPDGVNFTVQVQFGVEGPTVDCTPSNIPRSAALPVAVTFNASGTVKNPHCTAPTSLTE